MHHPPECHDRDSARPRRELHPAPPEAPPRTKGDHGPGNAGTARPVGRGCLARKRGPMDCRPMIRFSCSDYRRSRRHMPVGNVREVSDPIRVRPCRAQTILFHRAPEATGIVRVDSVAQWRGSDDSAILPLQMRSIGGGVADTRHACDAVPDGRAQASRVARQTVSGMTFALAIRSGEDCRSISAIAAFDGLGLARSCGRPPAPRTGQANTGQANTGKARPPVRIAGRTS